MAHEVHLHDSYTNNLNRLDDSAREQVQDIVAALGRDKFFQPDEENYVFERDDHEGMAICQHLNGWGDWQLLWYYKYVPTLPSTIDYIEVRLIQQPMRDLRPKENR